MARQRATEQTTSVPEVQVPPPPDPPAAPENTNPVEGDEGLPAQDDPLPGDSIANSGEWFDASYSSYEVLGLASVEPASRPPIIPYSSEMRDVLSWVSSDCENACVRLAPARPHRSLSASFFDRLFTIRRVLMAEAAKAGAPQTALAVLGVALDREALFLAAEETDMTEDERDRLLKGKPGNYGELAARLAPRLKPAQGQQAARALTPRPAKRVPPVSKARTGYLPFRARNLGILLHLGGPRAKSVGRTPSTPRGWDRRVHIRTLAGVESSWGSSIIDPVAEERCASPLGESATAPQPSMSGT